MQLWQLTAAQAPARSGAGAGARDREPRRSASHGIAFGVKDGIKTCDLPTQHDSPIYQRHQSGEAANHERSGEGGRERKRGRIPIQDSRHAGARGADTKSGSDPFFVLPQRGAGQASGIAPAGL